LFGRTPGPASQEWVMARFAPKRTTRTSKRGHSGPAVAKTGPWGKHPFISVLLLL
jgi:hypothetical protein